MYICFNVGAPAKVFDRAGPVGLWTVNLFYN